MPADGLASKTYPKGVVEDRRVEIIEELVFVIDTGDFEGVIAWMQRYGGRTPLLSSDRAQAVFALSSGILLKLHLGGDSNWGFHVAAGTGSKSHFRKLASACGSLRALRSGNYESEEAFYRQCGLQFIPPELREGNDEIQRARDGTLPKLVTAHDIRGDLHAHSMSSDGSDSIEDMAEAAFGRGYEYIGISDHSQSLKLAGGVSIADLRTQVRIIDRLNGKLRSIRVVKSSEVDILADGSLDYPEEILKELDYTVCPIHSRFGLNRDAQTERLMRAMDNRYFNILGHATGRLLLKRPGYEIDVDLLIEHARASGCFLEINSSPDRLDINAVHRAQSCGGRRAHRRLNRCAQHGRTRPHPVRTGPGAPSRPRTQRGPQLPDVEGTETTFQAIAQDLFRPEDRPPRFCFTAQALLIMKVRMPHRKEQ